MPPAPRTVTTMHPLLVRQTDAQGSMQTRAHHRQRLLRSSTGGHHWELYANSSNNSERIPNPTLILRRYS